MAISPKQRALNTVRYLRLSTGEILDLRKEKTLNVEMQGTQLYWPPEYVAQHCLRVALENGCTKIRVHQGVHRKTEYDVMTLCTVSRYLAVGNLSRPKLKLVPPKYVTKHRQMRFGEIVEPKRGYVSVPASPVSDHVASAG